MRQRPLRPPPLPRPRRARQQAGAAMVEFIVAALFLLVPLYLAVQAMGKFADVQHTAQAAARYAAWERTVWFNETASAFHQKNVPNQKSEAQIRSEIAVRVFNDRNTALRYQSSDKTQTSFAKGMDPLWQDTAGTPFLKDYANATLAGDMSKPSKDMLGSVLSVVSAVSIPHVTGSLVPPLPTQTLAQARFQLRDVAADSPVYRRLWSQAKGLPEDWAGFSTQTQAAVLTNAWNANSPSGTLAMVKESVPTSLALGQVVEVGAKAVIYAWQPNLALTAPLDIGKIGVDVVPPDRLRR